MYEPRRSSKLQSRTSYEDAKEEEEEEELNETDVSFSTYIYGISMILSHLINKQYDDIKPSTIAEYVVIGFLIICGNLMLIFIIFPKVVAEALLKCRRFCTFYPEVHRIIEETKRHNPNSIAHIDVEKFYTLMWKKHHGITSIPEVISQMPRYLRIDIKQDLIWPVFYHSPTLRKTSEAYKRWLCEYVHIDYKLPGQKFYAGPYCKTHLYYLKSGIVQLISCDDGATPLISVTSGTIFGDISFYLPPSKRNVLTRCLTYCEVLYITRIDILQSLHMFPEDRHLVLNHVKNRIKHSRILYTCKQHIRGLDRSEDEGIAWVKRRWWEICEAVNSWNKSSKKEGDKCQLPAEESSFHCAKYIGQLVLCSNVQLNMKSMFANEKFPWIFVPDSKFGQIWGKIVTATGSILSEYPNDDGELMSTIYGSGQLLTCFGVFFRTVSLRTLTAYTDCEVYAESLNLAQSGFMRLNLGKFQISREHLGLGLILLFLGFIFWYVICYSLTLLILNYRGNTIFQHAVGQLGKFLKAERVEDSLINRTKAHFRYWWVRTVEATDTLLRGGETLERELASSATQLYFLPNEVIMREMDLNPWIFIVHRGKIAIKQDGEKLATLTKGSIFGQLEGLLPRPIRVTAVSEDFADILQLTIKEFQEIIDDKVRNNIKENPQSKLDFMAIKRIMLENPYNTVKYLLRGRKSIKLPVVALTLKEIYFKLLINMIIYLAEIWILSVVISAIYTKYRELYAYDYDVINLIRYLKHSGLSPILLKSVKEYTNQLWKRQRGNWLPELAQQAPQCLREDLLGSLYLHHLLTTPLFSDLPVYFNRQLVARLQRVVIFPGW
ncbi:unnamed protein product [Danaus chrysippus]|uniref:(African queen) hypothetical protein n=1 Tax=Danaus chrysippus TaxID=151541 RepID=A0A8J2W098_9NEOP|nr:unnamed protein product [Danaus chrysippus]